MEASEIRDNLLSVAENLDKIGLEAKASSILDPVEKVRSAANQVARAFNGGWLGYHSRVYYRNFEPVPAGAHFSTEWGFDVHYVTHPTTGDWVEYTFEAVREQIFSEAGVQSLADAEEFASKARESFRASREEVLSALAGAGKRSNEFLDRLKKQVTELKIASKGEFVRAVQPRGSFMSRDMHAVTQGLTPPPHIVVAAEAAAIEVAIESCDKLAKMARRAASHFRVSQTKKSAAGEKVFIGHGRSNAWRDLKDFLSERLGLPWDEFNRVPVAGMTNITRLTQMLDDAVIAFLVLTGEDERADAKLNPRMNVVHEAGLFQGRLGFTRAIVLLEEGCEQFSNIEGLGQIPFPKGNIKAAFEEVRRVLEREGIIDTS